MTAEIVMIGPVQPFQAAIQQNFGLKFHLGTACPG